MSAVDHVVEAVVEPDVGTTAWLHRERCRQLSREWPSLASALTWLLIEHGKPVPAEWRTLEDGLER